VASFLPIVELPSFQSCPSVSRIGHKTYHAFVGKRLPPTDRKRLLLPPLFQNLRRHQKKTHPSLFFFLRRCSSSTSDPTKTVILLSTLSPRRAPGMSARPESCLYLGGCFFSGDRRFSRFLEVLRCYWRTCFDHWTLHGSTEKVVSLLPLFVLTNLIYSDWSGCSVRVETLLYESRDSRSQLLYLLGSGFSRIAPLLDRLELVMMPLIKIELYFCPPLFLEALVSEIPG